MSFSADLQWRGLIKDKTFDDVAWIDKAQTFYWGVDVSAPSMTVGNLAAVCLARRLAGAGWSPVLLVGGGTSLVGDPGGKTEERQLKSREEIEANVAAVKEQVTRLFKGDKFEMVDNYEWLSGLNYLDFLRDVGKHFSMTELMQREFVDARMGEAGSGISYAEFSYSLLQGYDYWQLYDRFKTVLQIGGSDQWGNMLSGVSLIRKKEGAEVHAMSMPLVIDKKTGQKFGKSEAGAIWLDPEMTTPTQFYQFWLNSSDEDVEDYLKVFSFLTHEQIDGIMAKHKADPTKRIAQEALAKNVTELVHGSGGHEASEAVTKYLTHEAPLHKASETELAQIRAEIPAVAAKPGDSLLDILVTSKLVDSKSEARRLLESKAIYVNNHTAEAELLAPADMESGRALIRRGKAYKDSALIELE